jgi:hypothetical protein
MKNNCLYLEKHSLIYFEEEFLRNLRHREKLRAFLHSSHLRSGREESRWQPKKQSGRKHKASQ